MATSEDKDRILIYLVDDDQDHLRLFQRLLGEQDHAFTFRTFLSPREALRAIAENPPDVVISDYLFGIDINGLTFLRKARDADLLTPFIFLTGQGNEEVAAEAFRLGAEDYFTKEIGFAHFMRIAQAIRRSAAHRRSELERSSFHSRYHAAEQVCGELMEEATDLIVILGSDGQIINANRKAEEISGYLLEEMLGSQFTRFIVPEDIDRISQIFSKLTESRTHVKTSLGILSRDGSRRPFEVSASCISAPSSELWILAIARDISEWKMKEQSLLWTQQMLEGVINAVEDVVHVVDRDLNVLYCNRAITSLTRGKLTGEQLVGRHLGEIFPFLEEKGVIAEYRKVLATGEPLQTEEVTEYKGHKIATLTYKLPVRDDTGKVDKIVTIMRDVTRDHLLQQERERLLRAVDEAVVGIAITDENDSCIYANKKAAEITGYDSPEQLLGKNWKMFTTDEIMAIRGEEIFRALADTGGWMGESSTLRRDGSTVPVFLSVNYLLGKDDIYQGHICIIQDISREKGMGEILAQKDSELEDLNRDLNSFVSMTSHELRSPLTNIEGFARLLEEKVEDLSPEEVRDFISRIRNNAGRLHHLIDDLLLFSRERRRFVENVNVGLKGLVDEVLAHLSHEIEAAGAQVTVNLEAGTISADRHRLYQILKNLVQNAVIYRRPEEPPRVTVEILPQEGGAVLFKVSDNGTGILETERETIFEIFRRGSSSRGKPGTGVGLALVRENVRRMGGSLWLESTPGAGSVFSFTLPSRA